MFVLQLFLLFLISGMPPLGAFLPAATNVQLPDGSHYTTANAFFFSLDDFFAKPQASEYMSSSEASKYPEYSALKSTFDAYSKTSLNSKPDVAKCLKSAYGSGYNSAQITAVREGRVIFSAYGSWDENGILTDYSQALSDRGASLKIRADSQSAASWIAKKDASSALGALSSGGIRVTPAWAPFALGNTFTYCMGLAKK